VSDVRTEVLGRYDPEAPLAEASTIPASWYLEPGVWDLERRTVFSRNWLVAGRADQIAEPGGFFTGNVGGEPILIVRGSDGVLRGFFNVCRHHAAEVETREAGKTHLFRCPYHGWTYSLAGELKGAPEFAEVCGFQKEANGLVPLSAEAWGGFLFVRLETEGPPLAEQIGSDLTERFRTLGLDRLRFFERRSWTIECNWKVFVDNYLDGGYHVPHLHKGLNSVIDYNQYSIANGERFSLQESPIVR